MHACIRMQPSSVSNNGADTRLRHRLIAWGVVILVIFLTAGDWTTALIGGMVLGFLLFFHVLSIGAACALTVSIEKKLHA